MNKKKGLFKSPDLDMDLRWLVSSEKDADVEDPEIQVHVETLAKRDLLGPSLTSEFTLKEGQIIYFILRQVPQAAPMSEEQCLASEETLQKAQEAGIPVDNLRMAAAYLLRPDDNPIVTPDFVQGLIRDTHIFWQKWISKSKYRGRWREAVRRSALVLKMLVFEETGAIVAAPTFSLPEYIGGTRNWDYRFTWVRDTSFTIYALIRLGFTDEAKAYVDFILARLKDRNSDGSLQMYVMKAARSID